MRLTKIETQKRSPNRRSIYIDDKFVTGIDEEVLLKFNLKEGMDIDADMLDKIIREEKKHKVKEQALSLLSYRARAKKELVNRLRQKGAEPQFMAEVMKELEALGLINDTEFANTWVKWRSGSYGPIRLRKELLIKGVSNELIDQALANFDELELAKTLVERWIRKHKNLAPEIFRRKLFNFLASRGISYETMKSLKVFGHSDLDI